MNRTLARAIFSTFASISLGLISLSANGLEWETQTLSFKASFGQEEVVAAYRFINVSGQPITITEARPSCGCTVPSLQKDTYAPGEHGELKAIFTVGDRQGPQHKTIVVSTLEDGEAKQERVYDLKLEVDIPVAIKATPRVRMWRIGDELKTQEVTIELNEEYPLEIDGVRLHDNSDAFAFDYELKILEPKLKYSLLITPKNTDSKLRDTVILTSGEDELGLLDSYYVYAYIR